MSMSIGTASPPAVTVFGAREGAFELAHKIYETGRVIYDKDLELARKTFLLSLNVQLVAKKVFSSEMMPKELPETFNEESLKKWFVGNEKFLLNVETFVEGSPTSTLYEVFDDTNDQEKFEIVRTLRWIGYCYQHIDEFITFDHTELGRRRKKQYYEFFNKIYGVAHSVLKKIGTKDSIWKSIEISFDTSIFLHDFYNSEDVEGAIRNIELIQLLLMSGSENGSLRSVKLLARTYNVVHQQLSKVKATPSTIWRGFKAMSEAVKIAEKEKDFDPSLRVLYLANKAEITLLALKKQIKLVDKNSKPIDVDQLEKDIEIVLKFAQGNKLVHAFYMMLGARLEIYRGKFQIAEQYLEKAEQIIKNFPESASVRHRARLEELRKKLLDPKKKGPVENDEDSYVPFFIGAPRKLRKFKESNKNL